MSQLNDRSNGGVNSLIEILKNLRSTTDITVITQFETEVNTYLRQNGIQVVVWNVYPGDASKAKKLFEACTFSLRLRRVTLKKRYDCVHVNDPAMMIRAGLFMSLFGGQKTINIRDVKPLNEAYGTHWNLIHQYDKVIVLSEEMKESLLSRLPVRRASIAHKFSVIYSIVDFTRFYKHEARGKESNLRSGEFIVGIIAKFSPKKQQLALLKYLAKNSSSLHGVTFIFVGDYNPSNRAYDRACKEILKSNPNLPVRVLGYQNNIEAVYQSIDLSVVATGYEGLARCMIEALSCGLPVVSFNVCSAKEILNPDCGMVIPQGRYDLLLEEINRLRKDNELYAKLSRASYQKSRRLFSSDEIVRSYGQCFFEKEEG